MTKMQAHLARIVRKFRGRTIAVLGDFMLDELWRGEATRISPEAPVPVVLVRDPSTDGPEAFPGGAGNVAANIAALGGRPIPFGAIGADETGARLSTLLESRGIPSATLVKHRGRVTPRKVRVVAHPHQLVRLDFENPAPLAAPAVQAIISKFVRWAARLDGLIISDYRKGSATTELCQRISALARQRRLPVYVDPKPDHPEICRHATVVTPNLREAEFMAGVSLKDRAALLASGRRLRAELDCANLLITRGPDGMTLFEAGGVVHEIPSVPRPVYDVTGAGDTVVATLALAHVSGATLEEAAQLANLAGGLVVLKFGTAQPSASELLQAIRAGD